MRMRNPIALAVALLAAPAFAQTTTTVQTQQPPPPPPPATTTTTVQTQPAQPPPAPSTQVVVNPSDPGTTTTTTSSSRGRVAADPEVTTVEMRSSTPPLQIVAVDALYGGLIGLVLGGGVTLIEQGNNWKRDLAVGAGIGVLGGAAFGVYDASTRSDVSIVRRAAADPAPEASTSGPAFALSDRF